jgi:hypothetical protein
MKAIKYLGALSVVFGVFLVVGLASASTADILQPASETMNVDSLRVGIAGQGGVFFVNGSVVNESGPYVVADDFRVDGRISRGEGADDPVWFADSVYPDETHTYNLGAQNYQWSEVHAQSMFSDGFGATPQASNHMPFTVYYNGSIRFAVYGSGHVFTKEDIDTEGNLEVGGWAQVDNYLKLKPRSNKPSCGVADKGKVIYWEDTLTSDHFYGCNGSTWVQLDN